MKPQTRRTGDSRDRRTGPTAGCRARPGRMRRAVLLACLCWLPAWPGALTAETAPAPEPDDSPPGIELHRTRRPSPGERARMVGWHERWREQASPLERLLGELGAEDARIPAGDPRWCRALGEALVAFDHESAFPVPSYAADAHLKRAVRRLVLGATACLEGRVYAATHRIRRAHEAFADAATVLRPYGVAP